MEIFIKQATTPPELEQAWAIRREVFVIEQRVPEDLEIDQWESTCTHFLALTGTSPVGTCRLRMLDPSTGKVERVAVLKSARSAGVGKRLMEACEHHARECGASLLVLNAQMQVVPFYEKLGYSRTGEPFEEAGIPHVKMSKRLINA
ncbi:GNAT family N-acetyltransferase [Staphylospora marina]|uniref:GNAT family N-acetyltransferase n=1 Tax=Staphylospora marina TaxID=2490858 RepID=UPI000F5BB60E|nr:GNAT family N-acetyltransferase [Staphylospora marina]